MDLFRTRLIVTVIALGLLAGALIGGVLYFVLPTFSLNWFVGILLFFIVVECLLMVLVESFSRKKDKKQLLNIYLLTKVIKLITSLGFVTVYTLTDKTDIKSFIAVFLAFYMLFLLIETYLFAKVEKHIKIKKNEDE